MGSVVLTVLAAAGFGLGQALQKHGVAARLPRLRMREIFTRPGAVLRGVGGNATWWGGTAVLTAGGVCDVQALAWGDVSVVRPIVTLQSAFAVGAGVWLMRERLTLQEWGGLALLASGAGLVGSTAVVTHGEPTSPFLNTLMFAATVAVGGFVVFGQRRASRWAAPELGFSFAAGLFFGIADYMLKVGTVRVGDFLIISFGSLLELAKTLEVWFVVGGTAAGFALLQLAFSHGRVSLVNPIAAITGMSLTVSLGFTFLGEEPRPLRLTGIVLVIVGMGALLARRGTSAPETSAGSGRHGPP